MDYRSKRKTRNYKTPRREHRQNTLFLTQIFWLKFFKCLLIPFNCDIDKRIIAV